MNRQFIRHFLTAAFFLAALFIIQASSAVPVFAQGGSIPTAAEGSTLNKYRPSGFYIDSGIEHGTLTASPELPVSDGSDFRTIQSRTYFKLIPSPDDGYVLKDLFIESVSFDNGEAYPDDEYYIPLEDGLSFYADKYSEGYLLFRICAVFEQGESEYAIDVRNLSEMDPRFAGNTIYADKTTALAGEEVTLTVVRQPGIRLDEYSLGATLKKYPRVTYYAYDADDVNGYSYKDIELTKTSADTYSFTVPYDVFPSKNTINVEAAFKIAEYDVIIDESESADETGSTITVEPAYGHKMDDLVTVNVTMPYKTSHSLRIYSVEEDGEHEIPAELTDTFFPGNYQRITCSYTFRMPDNDAHILADFSPTIYDISEIGIGYAGDISLAPAVTVTIHGAGTTFAGAGQLLHVRVDMIGSEPSSLYGVKNIWYTYIEDGETKRGEVADFKVNEMKNAYGTFVMPDSDVVFHAEMEPLYMITSEAGNWFDYTVPEPQYFSAGDEVRLSVTPKADAENYMSIADPHWTASYGDFSKNDCNPAEFIMPEHDVVVRADYAFRAYERSWNGTSVVSERVFTENATMLSDFTGTTLSSGWYILDANKTINGRLTISGDVKLLLRDGKKLSLTGGGIELNGKNSLSVYGGDADSGVLDAVGGKYQAGIGGGDEKSGGILIVHGGTVKAKGGEYGAGIGSGDEADSAGNFRYVQYGGSVTANGGDEGAGIGGGNDSNGGSVTIYGGTLKATGGELGAGIGGGDAGNCGTTEVYGGNVTVRGGEDAAGIGGGEHADQGGDISIYGGTVDVDATTPYGAGIGGGEGSDGGNVTITGGQVKVTGRGYSAAIGGANTFTIYERPGSGGNVRILGGRVEMTLIPARSDTYRFWDTDYGYAIADAVFGLSVGSLYIEKDLMVTHTDLDGKTTVVSRYNRVHMCRAEAQKVIIEPCTHPSINYTVTEETHKKNCPHCYYEFNEESHILNSEYLCTECGYQQAICSITFNANGGKGSMKTAYVVPGASYPLPDCTFTAPSGFRFKEWSVRLGEAQAVSKDPGDIVDVIEDIEVSPVWSKGNPTFETHSLVLGDQIGINFFVDLSMLSTFEKEGAVMRFTLNGKSMDDPYDKDFTNPSSHGFHGFTCYASSVEMADEITAILCFGNGETVSETYSIKQYVDAFLANSAGYPDNTVALVKAVADYGHYVQPYLSAKNKWTIGKDYAFMPGQTDLTDDDILDAADALTAYTVSRDLGSSQIKKATFSLSLDSETVVNIYLTMNKGFTGTVTASAGDTPLLSEKLKDGRYRIRVGGIPAHMLGNTYDVSVSAGGSAEFTVSALAYANALLNSTGSITDDKDAALAMTALYRYYEAAASYSES